MVSVGTGCAVSVKCSGKINVNKKKLIYSSDLWLLGLGGRKIQLLNSIITLKENNVNQKCVSP